MTTNDATPQAQRLARLQHTLEHEIPLTVAIGVWAVSYGQGCLTLAAPLAPNINHKDTAFAGSINALVTLAGWGLVWCLLDESGLEGKIVIQESAIEYLRPISFNFAAHACLPDAAQVQRFLETLRRKRRARLELAATIEEDGALAVRFRGRYVAQR
jgi:thioesterase domain-containing protein